MIRYTQNKGLCTEKMWELVKIETALLQWLDPTVYPSHPTDPIWFWPCGMKICFHLTYKFIKVTTSLVCWVGSLQSWESTSQFQWCLILFSQWQLEYLHYAPRNEALGYKVLIPTIWKDRDYLTGDLWSSFKTVASTTFRYLAMSDEPRVKERKAIVIRFF